MEMRMRKKAMYFTLLVMAFLVIFLFIFVLPSYQRLSDKMLAIEMRIDAINNFIKSLNRDIERGLYISSYRALLSLEGYIIEKGKFLNNTDNDFKEAMLNGTLYNQNLSLMKDDKVTFPDWIENIKRESKKMNLNVELLSYNFTIYQKDPWRITVGVNYTLVVNETTGLALWRRNEYTETNIDLTGFEDPLYIVFGLGRITNVINKTIYENNFTYKINNTWNVSNLLEHIGKSLYLANRNAPNFLGRLGYNISPSEFGIESFVYLPELQSQGIDINEDTSIIDYYYFPDEGNAEYRINFTPSWVKIDDSHRAKYNVTLVSYPIS